MVMRSDLSQAMEAKLRGYMDQDTAAGSAWEPEDYVDVAHIMELHSTQGGVCAHCAAWLPPRCKPADPEQATVDRLDNALAHVKGSLPALQPHAPLERESFVFFTYSLGL